MAKKLFSTTILIGVTILVGACSSLWTAPLAVQKPTFNSPTASTKIMQPNAQRQPAIQNGYGIPQMVPDGGWNQQSSMNQPASQSENNYGNMPGDAWMQQEYKNQSGPYGRGSGMRGSGQRGGWNGYDNCLGGYGYNNGYAPGQPSGNNIPQATSQQVSFSTDIQPIFNSRCISCHGGTEGLYLDSYAGVMNGSMSWPVVIPGDPINSRLIQLVSSEYMPYGGPPLSQDEVQSLVNWVAAGAPND